MKKIELNDKQKEFLKEFASLLRKYHVSITWTCDECSDTFGLYNDRIVLEMLGAKDIDFLSSIDHYDIEKILKLAGEEIGGEE